jgi:hypothetical protein
MDKKLEQKIYKKYPGLFKHTRDMHKSLMCFGLECRDGWYKLINKLCKDIYNYYVKKEGVVPEDFYVVQVKEKWGSLRFYVTAAPEEIHDMIAKAEHESFYICEVCGIRGEMFYRDELPWVQTLCDSCLDKLVRERYGYMRDKEEDFVSCWQKNNHAPFKIIDEGEL